MKNTIITLPQPPLKKRKQLTLPEWKKEGKKLYGKQVAQWQFKCPACGGVQSKQDFIDANIENADSKFYFSCIGRWVKGKGCNWTLGGLLQIHKREVISEEGKLVPVFEFADDLE